MFGERVHVFEVVLFDGGCCFLFCSVSCSALSIASCFVWCSVRSHLLQGVFVWRFVRQDVFCSDMPLWLLFCSCLAFGERWLNGAEWMFCSAWLFGLNGRSCSVNGAHVQSCEHVSKPNAHKLLQQELGKLGLSEDAVQVIHGKPMGEAYTVVFAQKAHFANFKTADELGSYIKDSYNLSGQ